MPYVLFLYISGLVFHVAVDSFLHCPNQLQMQFPALASELQDPILDRVIHPTAHIATLARLAVVCKGFNERAKPDIAAAFNGMIRAYSANNNFVAIVQGLRRWVWMPEMQATLLGTLLLCPANGVLHGMCARVVIYIMLRYPSDVEVQRAAVEFLARKNADGAVGPYVHDEAGYGGDAIVCDEIVALCSALELFGEDPVVCRHAMRSLSLLSALWYTEYTVNPTSPELWEQALPLWDMFGLENGRRNRIVLNALRCITLWNHGQHTVHASDIIVHACHVLQYTLQGAALVSAVPGGPPGVPCLMDVGRVVLAVVEQNTVQQSGNMQYIQRMSWQAARFSADRILKSLLLANRFSADLNLPAVLSAIAIGGDNEVLDTMTCCCTNVARQREFCACGPPFFDWVAHMMTHDFVSAPAMHQRDVLKNFLRFLAALCHNNGEVQSELNHRQVPERLCRVLGMLHRQPHTHEHSRLSEMKSCVVAALGTLFACPMHAEQLLHLKQLFDCSLLACVVQMMPQRLLPARYNVTATHCMCILSHLLQSYTRAYSPKMAMLCQNAVLWMDVDPDNKALLAAAFSLLCVTQLDNHNNAVNTAIIRAFSCMYKFPSDASLLTQCVLFLHRVSCDTPESQNILRDTMHQPKLQLFSSAHVSGSEPNSLRTTMHPAIFLLHLSRSAMPQECGYLVEVINKIIANTQKQ